MSGDSPGSVPGPLLYPNLGAEEDGAGWQRHLHLPKVAAAARLWRLLFAKSARYFDGGANEVESLLCASDWPGDLDTRDGGAAFDWLEDADGLVPWLADAAAHTTADAAGLACSGTASEAVRTTSDKGFAVETAEELGLVPRQLRGTTVVLSPDELQQADAVAARIDAERKRWAPVLQDRFTLKPRFGTSGRGRLDVTGSVDPQKLAAALPRLAKRGGAVLEPWLERCRDLSVQLRVDEDGGVLLLGSLEQCVSASGAYLGHRGEVDTKGRVFSPDGKLDESMREAGAMLAAAAAQRGYRGPCGVDGLVFLWRGDEPEDGLAESDAREILRPVLEFNARFTMGTVTIGLVRRSLERVREAFELGPGDRRAFALAMEPPVGGWQAACDRAGEGAFVIPLGTEPTGAEQSVTENSVIPALLFAGDSSAIRAGMATDRGVGIAS